MENLRKKGKTLNTIDSIVQSSFAKQKKKKGNVGFGELHFISRRKGRKIQRLNDSEKKTPREEKREYMG